MNSTDLNNKTLSKCIKAEFNLYHVTLIVVAIMIIIVNTFVFVFIYFGRNLKRNAGNLILMGLSLNDFMTGISIFLHMIPKYYYLMNPCNLKHKMQLGTISNTGYIIGKICLLCSVGHLLLLAGERMVGLFLPLHYKSMIVRKRVLPAIISVWLFSLALPPIELTYRKSNHKPIYIRIQTTFTVVCFGVLPTIFLCLQYIAMLSVIYRFQRKHGTELKTILAKHKALFIYMAMFISFLFLSMPYFAIRIIIAYTSYKPTSGESFLRLIIILRYVPSLLNPFIYALFKDDFRRAFIRVKRSYTRRGFSETETTKTLLSRLSSYSPRTKSILMNVTTNSNYANSPAVIRNFIQNS